MKKILSIFIMSITLSILSCANYPLSQNEMKGKINYQGITSYQYGTHTFKTGSQFFALRSSVLDLDQFVGQKVIIRFEKIIGYPVDGGPDFLEVLEVK